MDTEQQIVASIEKSAHAKVRFAVTDIDGVLRGKVISKKKWLKAVKEGVGFCNVIFGWDVADASYTNSVLSGWHTGYPDAMASIDVSTYRTIPWNDELPFFLADFSNAPEIKNACPRTLLKHVVDECTALGYTTQFAKEFEWFNFIETPQSLQDKSFTRLQSFTPGMFGYSLLRTSQNQAFYNDVFNLLQRFNIPLEGLHTETGDGVYEAAIEHSNILEAADRAVLFKTSVKEIAYRHGLIACFMAKWNSNLPGCSGHIHQSLWDSAGKKNVFYDASKEDKISETLQHYIAGQLYCLPHIMPMYAPTVNSYKRYVEGAWSSTTVSWGIENRTTALRVINHSQNDMRLETRVPGADTNAYLTMAASLASGLYGIKNKLPLEIVATKGNEYANTTNKSLHKNLHDATEAMRTSNIAKELFGEGFVDHFTRTRMWEWQQFSTKVTDWELKRYFEII